MRVIDHFATDAGMCLSKRGRETVSLELKGQFLGSMCFVFLPGSRFEETPSSDELILA